MTQDKKTNPAYLYLKKYVQRYLKANFDTLSEKYLITKEDLRNLKKDENLILEWVLGEYLEENELKEIGVTIESGWGIEDENTYTSIYKIGRKFVKNSFINGDYHINHTFDFVKPVKEKVIIYRYEKLNF